MEPQFNIPFPPFADVLAELEYAVLPAAAGAAFVMCVFLLFGRWAGALGSALAVVGGFAWANYATRHLGGDESPLLPWKPDSSAKPWEWLPHAALVLLVVGLLSRWLGLIASRNIPERRWWIANALVWLPRVAAVAVVSRWLISERAATEFGWLVWALAAAMLLEWIALDGVARTSPGPQVAAFQSAMFFAASTLLLYHHWTSTTHVAVMVGSAMLGVAAAANLKKADTSGTVPAGVGFLPGLIMAGWLSQDSGIPQTAFWLLALAPLTLLPFLIPALSRRTTWPYQLIRFALVLAPLVAALILAAQHEKLAFDTDY